MIPADRAHVFSHAPCVCVTQDPYGHVTAASRVRAVHVGTGTPWVHAPAFTQALSAVATAPTIGGPGIRALPATRGLGDAVTAARTPPAAAPGEEHSLFHRVTTLFPGGVPAAPEARPAPEELHGVLLPPDTHPTPLDRFVACALELQQLATRLTPGDHRRAYYYFCRVGTVLAALRRDRPAPGPCHGGGR